MPETMTCYERVEKAWNLEEADRVPVAPMVIYILPYLAGVSFWEMIADPEMLAQAAIDQSDLVGDFIHPALTILDHQTRLTMQLTRINWWRSCCWVMAALARSAMFVTLR